ncbi:MAG: NfeD family protein [Defluviitaleaceae bacterium]|nr:NfeD family protein [Defluviitaleaceae bacterium]
MQALFNIAFGVGMGYTIISLLIGNFLSDCDFSTGNSFVPFLRPAPICAFLIVFGGSGIILYRDMGFAFTVIISLLLALAISYCIIKFILMPLHKAQNTSTINKQELIGKTAVVTSKIFENSFGKISYNVNGNNFSSPAKSENEKEIQQGSNVEIVSIKNHTYFVKQL